jgi:hypothetical protein
MVLSPFSRLFKKSMRNTFRSAFPKIRLKPQSEKGAIRFFMSIIVNVVLFAKVRIIFGLQNLFPDFFRERMKDKNRNSAALFQK